MDQKELIAALKEIADTNWAKEQNPILLSEVGPILAKKSEDADYKTLLRGKSLKSFIKETGNEHGYQLLVHPTQRAKIGLAPLTAQFEYPNAASEELPKKSEIPRKRENKAMTLLDILATLPEEELAKITIPVSSIIKLLK